MDQSIGINLWLSLNQSIKSNKKFMIMTPFSKKMMLKI